MSATVPLRRQVLIQHLRSVGIADEKVLDAMSRIPRELFVPRNVQHQAYEDYALEIGEGQTISQPSVVARITELAEVGPKHRVLEIGAGSGYQAAVLATLGKFVFAVERIGSLARTARERLHRLGFANVSIQVMDGTLGWRAQAPFDAIVVSAGAPAVPDQLLDQLAEGGRLVIPVGGRDQQQLVRVVRHGDDFEEAVHGVVRFVPLVGRAGFVETA